MRPSGIHFFVPALLLSMLTHLLSSLSYFILAVPMHKCLEKHSCMSSFPIVLLYDTSFFPDSATTSAQKRIRCELVTLADALVTLYQLNYVETSQLLVTAPLNCTLALLLAVAASAAPTSFI